MNENGWILLSRNLLKWGWFDKSEMVHLWIYLLLAANVEPKKWHGVTVKRGQIVTSVRKLSERLHLTTQQIRTALNRLQDTDEINIQTTSQYTLITICNYSTYQDYDPAQQQTNNKPITIEQQTNNKPITTTKQLTINNNNNSLSPTRARETETKNFSTIPGTEARTSAPTDEEKEKSSAQKEKDFTPPTVEQVRQYCQMTGLIHVNEVLFVAHYESTGWCNGSGTPLRSWQAAAIKWNEKEKQTKYQQQNANRNNKQAGAGRHASCEPRTDVRADEF